MQYLGNSFHYLRNVTSCSQAGGVAHLRSVLTAASLGPRYRPQIHTSRVARNIPITLTLQGANTLFWAPLVPACAYPACSPAHAHMWINPPISLPLKGSTFNSVRRFHPPLFSQRPQQSNSNQTVLCGLRAPRYLGLTNSRAPWELAFTWCSSWVDPSVLLDIAFGTLSFFFLLRMHPAHVFLRLLPCHKLKKTRILLHPHWELLAYCPLYKYLCSLKLDGGDRQIRSLWLLWARAIATMLTTQFCAFAPLCFLALVIPFPADKMWTIAHPTYLHGS